MADEREPPPFEEYYSIKDEDDLFADASEVIFSWISVLSFSPVLSILVIKKKKKRRKNLTLMNCLPFACWLVTEHLKKEAVSSLLDEGS